MSRSGYLWKKDDKNVLTVFWRWWLTKVMDLMLIHCFIVSYIPTKNLNVLLLLSNFLLYPYLFFLTLLWLHFNLEPLPKKYTGIQSWILGDRRNKVRVTIPLLWMFGVYFFQGQRINHINFPNAWSYSHLILCTLIHQKLCTFVIHWKK